MLAATLGASRREFVASLDLLVSMLVTAESVLHRTHETPMTKYDLVVIMVNWAGPMKSKALILVALC